MTLTGAVEESWSGDATVTATEFAGPPSVYVARHGDTEVRLFAADRGYAPTVEVDAGEATYGISLRDHDSIRPDGSGADVRTTAIQTGIGGPDLHVDATFRC